MSLEKTPENLEWKATLDELGISYRQRRISGAIVALCMFHDEKTPSMYMWPDGNLYCHGCTATERVEGFVERALLWREKAELFQAKVRAREAEHIQKYGPDTWMPPF